MDSSPAEFKKNYSSTMNTPPPEGTYKKSVLPWSLILMGATAMLVPLFITIPILPQFSKLIENLGGGSNGFLFLLPIIGVVSIFIAQIFYGVMLLTTQKRQGGLNAVQRKIAIYFFVFGLIAGVLAIPALIFSIISPIYSFMDTIK